MEAVAATMLVRAAHKLHRNNLASFWFWFWFCSTSISVDWTDRQTEIRADRGRTAIQEHYCGDGITNMLRTTSLRLKSVLLIVCPRGLDFVAVLSLVFQSFYYEGAHQNRSTGRERYLLYQALIPEGWFSLATVLQREKNTRSLGNSEFKRHSLQYNGWSSR